MSHIVTANTMIIAITSLVGPAVVQQGTAQSLSCDPKLSKPLDYGTIVTCTCTVTGNISYTHWNFKNLALCSDKNNMIRLAQIYSGKDTFSGTCGDYLSATNTCPQMDNPPSICNTSILNITADVGLNGLVIECQDRSTDLANSPNVTVNIATASQQSTTPIAQQSTTPIAQQPTTPIAQLSAASIIGIGIFIVIVISIIIIAVYDKRRRKIQCCPKTEEVNNSPEAATRATPADQTEIIVYTSEPTANVNGQYGVQDDGSNDTDEKQDGGAANQNRASTDGDEDLVDVDAGLRHRVTSDRKSELMY